MDRGAWQAAVHGVTKSWTRLNDFHNSSHRTTPALTPHPQPPSSWPTSSSPKPAASEQDAGIFLPRSSPGNPPIPAALCFGISAKCKGPGCLPCLSKHWINLLCLFSWKWSWFISSCLSSWEGVTLIGCAHNCLGASLVAQMVKNQPAMEETWVPSLGQKIPWSRKWQQ